MKKLVYLSVAIAVGIAAASCQQVEPVPSEITEGSTFALNAGIEMTKTSINGLEVSWEEGDILYLVTTDGTWGKPYSEDKTASTIAEYAYSSGSFTSKATIANGTYTFNALYDGSVSQKSYHRGASTTYNLQSTQSQDCSNPTEHLKLNDALVGTFNATVPMAAPASVSMSHIFAIMRVDVKNATGSDVELKSFEMSAAGANLAGVYTVNFANTPIDITEKQNLSNSITVNLTNGTVANGSSLPVYFVMAPLANYSGDVTFTVTDVNNVEYSKTVSLTNISFEAGSLNTTPYKITNGVVPETPIYSTEFNYAIVGSSYQGSNEIVGTDSEGNTSWGITYGNWNGSKCAQLRVYTAGNFGCVYNKFDVSYATKVSYKAGVSNTNLKLNTYYSTDSGMSWVKVDGNKALTTTLTEYSFTISETGEFEKNRIKFEVTGTKPSSNNYYLTIDDVAIYGNGEILETIKTKLDSPKNLKANLSTSSVNSIEVAWDAVDNADSYVVTAKSTGGTEVSKEITTNSHTFVGLDYETEYTISVYAKSSDTSLYTDSDITTYAETIKTGAKPSSGSASWVRVKTVSELLSGGTFIIGYEATANSGIIIPMANTGSATTSAAGFIYSGSEASSGGNNTINMSTVSETSKYEVTIVASTSVSGAICIKLGDNYLGNTNTRNNCKLFTSESATTSFTPTVGSNDVFTLKIDANTGENTNYTTLQYNTGTPRFAVYADTQKNVVIYKKN